MSEKLYYKLMAIASLSITLLPVGIAVVILGFGFNDSPCVLCWQERMGMIVVSLIAIIILRYGAKNLYLGLIVFTAVFGIFMTLRHTGNHISRDIGQGFSVEILGSHTYTWAILVYWAIIAVAAIFIIFSNFETKKLRLFNGFEKFVTNAFLVIVFLNAIQAFMVSGLPPFIGHGDPARLTFNVKLWDWNLDEWPRNAPSLRGYNSIEKPDLPK